MADNWVEVPIPPSANGLWKSTRGKKGSKVRVYLSKAYQDYLEVVIPQLVKEMPKETEFPLRLSIEIIGGKGWRQGRDASNVIKALEDTIKRAERIPDDNTDYIAEIYVVYFEPAKAKQKAMCKVRLTPAGG